MAEGTAESGRRALKNGRGQQQGVPAAPTPREADCSCTLQAPRTCWMRGMRTGAIFHLCGWDFSRMMWGLGTQLLYMSGTVESPLKASAHPAGWQVEAEGQVSQVRPPSPYVSWPGSFISKTKQAISSDHSCAIPSPLPRPHTLLPSWEQC